MQDTDQKHKSSLDKITKLEQNLKNEKKIISMSNYSLFFAFIEFNLVITRYFTFYRSCRSQIEKTS